MSIWQLDTQGHTKIENAIILLQAYEPPEGYYLANSGGKDSTVCRDLVIRAQVKYDGHFNRSPMDPPEVVAFLKEHHPETVFDNHAQGFWGKKHFLRHGPPNRRVRWCCEIIKEYGGNGRVKVMGMRRAESNRRAGYHCVHSRRKGELWILPIVSWSTAEVWEYIRTFTLPYCSLYAEGFSRIGCVLCPMSSAKHAQAELTRFPKIALAWRHAFDRYFQVRIERGNPVPFRDAEEMWQWWLSRKKKAE